MPTHHGEKVVLRLARPASELLELERLRMPEEVRRRFEGLLAEPQGMIVLTGPTGSGKTTTLYSALGHVHESRGEVASLATIEDPVEIDLPFLDQTAVDRAAGLDFRDALRAVLRQDPNVLMVGEVRDAETAGAAVQAALSGHLILTTLHAGSAAGVFPRLIDLGVEPFLAASSVLAAASQRLARRLCPACRHPAPATRAQAAELTARRIDATGLTFQVAEGCSRCGGSGNAGRVPIFELLPATPELRREITAGANTDRLEELAAGRGMVPLRPPPARSPSARR
jgi:general secretion pathway protein E